jgi:hypothetical protein
MYDTIEVMLYPFTILFGIVFASIHALAEWLALYWRYDWLDIPMHILGGVVIVLMLASLRQIISPLARLSTGWLCTVLIATLIFWELFGIFRYGGLKPGFALDTTLDIICGFFGIILGYYLVRVLKTIDRMAQ